MVAGAEPASVGVTRRRDRFRSSGGVPMICSSMSSFRRRKRSGRWRNEGIETQIPSTSVHEWHDRNPKAPRSHHNILNNAASNAEVKYTETDRADPVPVPLFRNGPGHTGCVARSHDGYPAESSRRLTPDAIAEERCTSIHGVPTMFIACSSRCGR
jgi:hypothetical protein